MGLMEDSVALTLTLASVAAMRTRKPDGTFAHGKLLSPEQRREKNRIKQAAWNAENPERRLATASRERQRNKSRYAAWYAARPTYKADHKRKQLRDQAGRPKPEVCEIPGCGRSDSIHFDHDHKTQKFRGWICQACNKALGYVRDDPARLRALADYLEATRANQA